MRICVIVDDEPLKLRIGRALAACREHDAGQSIRADQAEASLAAQKPDVVLIASNRLPEQTVAMVARIRDLTSGHLLVVGPVLDPRTVLGVLRGGAADYVDEAAVEEELAPALERLKSGRAGSRANPGRLIAVLGPSGGGGASMLTANLALAMARSQERSLAVDLNPRNGDLAAMYDVRPSHTLQDLCRVATRIDRVLFEQTLSKLPTGVSLLASPRGFEAVLSTEGVTRVLELGRDLFPRVVADCDPALPQESLAALRSADSILMILRLEFNSLRNAKTMLDHLERQRVDPKKISLVANRVGQPKEIPAAKVEEALERKFFAKLPDDPKAALGSQNNGIPVLIEYPSSRLSKALVMLASALDALPAPEAKGT
jgi:pilus assembly protein CpaE